MIDDEDGPRVRYAYPTSGHDWQPDPASLPVARQDHDAPAELLLEIAKDARSRKEIWENYRAEHRFRSENPDLVESNAPASRPMGAFYMLDDFYISWVLERGIPQEYASRSKADLARLMRKWASGEIALDDDAQSLAQLHKNR